MTQRPATQRKGVFISYALADAKPFADALRQLLENQRLEVWQDVVSLRGGEDWWDQITDALDHVEFMVMILTPKSLERPTVQREWRYARQHGVCVLPILASDELIVEALPKWLSRIQIYRLGVDPNGIAQNESWTRFLNDLQTTCATTREPFMAEDIPPDYVPRPALSDQLVSLLLDENRQKPVAAFKGAGGYGKTSLARAICHEDAIRETFYHGILWVTLGENATRDTIFERVESLIYALSGEKSAAPTLESAVKRLAELWQDRELLLVIDDVWRADHLKYFMDGGARVARLITTRINDVLPEDTRADRTISVSEMEATEAAQMLAHGIPIDAPQTVKPHIDALAVRLGEYPLLLKLANGMLRDRIRLGNDITAALDYVNKALTRRGLGVLRKDNTDDRHRAVDVTLGLSVDLLNEEEKSRFMRLAIFRDDLDIPLAALEKLWGYDDFDTEELCKRLDDLSLLLKFDLPAQTIRLHDVVRQYLREINAAALPAMNAAFLDAYQMDMWANLPDDEPYLWDELFYHLAEADRADQLTETALDLWYIARKTSLRGITKTEADLSQSQDSTVTLLQRQYANMAHILDRCEHLLETAKTLHTRLSHLDALQPSCATLALKLEGQAHITAWKPLPDLPHPALIRTFTGHVGSITACKFSPNARTILSSSKDNTLNLWDVFTGEIIRSFSGHKDQVNDCAFSPDGRFIISASDDNTLKLWDINTSEVIRSFLGHTDRINTCTFSPDGKHIITASEDKTIKLWDIDKSEAIYSFLGHSDNVNTCIFSPNSPQILSASWDRTLKLWDIKTGEIIRTFKHESSINDCAFSPDGKTIISASADLTLNLWDVETGEIIYTFVEHTANVNSCDFSPNGEFIIYSSADWLGFQKDNTLIMYDVVSKKIIQNFIGHTDGVTTCEFSPDGHFIVSGSRDNTLKLWDTTIPEPININEQDLLEGITACEFSKDGDLLLTAATDYTLKLWDTHSQQIIRTFDDHLFNISGCEFSPDEQFILSYSLDFTIKLWDTKSGEVIRNFGEQDLMSPYASFSPDGKKILTVFNYGTSRNLIKLKDIVSRSTINIFTHSEYINKCAFSPDGKTLIVALNKADIGLLKLWDIKKNIIICTFREHAENINACLFSPNGEFILSASDDHTLKLWDVNTGQLIRSFIGHTQGVNTCAFMLRGQYFISTSRDKTLKLWNTETGVCLATFYADSHLNSCTIHPDGKHIIAGGDSGLYWLKIEGLS